MFVEVSEEWFVYKTELYTIDVVFNFFICLHLFHHFYQRMPLPFLRLQSMYWNGML